MLNLTGNWFAVEDGSPVISMACTELHCCLKERTAMWLHTMLKPANTNTTMREKVQLRNSPMMENLFMCGRKNQFLNWRRNNISYFTCARPGKFRVFRFHDCFKTESYFS